MTRILKLSTRHPIAAKDYRCIICNQDITKGEKHERLSYIDYETLPGTCRLKCLRFHCHCPQAPAEAF